MIMILVMYAISVVYIYFIILKIFYIYIYIYECERNVAVAHETAMPEILDSIPGRTEKFFERS